MLARRWLKFEAADVQCSMELKNCVLKPCRTPVIFHCVMQGFLMEAVHILKILGTCFFDYREGMLTCVIRRDMRDVYCRAASAKWVVFGSASRIGG